MDHRTAARHMSRESVMWSASRQCNYWIWIGCIRWCNRSTTHTHKPSAVAAPSSRRAHSFSFFIFLRILFSFFFERFFSFSPLKYTQKHLTLQQICPWDFFPSSLFLASFFSLLLLYLFIQSLSSHFSSTPLHFSFSALVLLSFFSSLLFSFFFLFCSLCFLLSVRGTKGSQSVTCPRCSELPLLHHPPRSLLRLPSPLPPPAHQLPPLRCPQPQPQPQAQPQPLRSQRRGRWR